MEKTRETDFSYALFYDTSIELPAFLLARALPLDSVEKNTTPFQLLMLSPSAYKDLKDRDYFLAHSETRCIILGNVEEWDSLDLSGEEIIDLRAHPPTPSEAAFLMGLFEREIQRYKNKMSSDRNHLLMMEDTQRDQETLIEIGRSLSLIKDQNKLLRSILLQSKKITGADAGSIFLVEKNEAGGRQLRFKYSDTFSVKLSYEEFTLPLNTQSIAGYVAVTGRVLNLKDVYKLPEDAPVSFNSSFDKTNNYRTKSMLVVPMRNHIDDVIGVIQLINSKESLEENSTGNEAFEVRLRNPKDYEEKVVPFAQRYEALLESIASQAAIALENSRMIKQIEDLFESFVRASVSAIESRDPATSGHSFRVAELTLKTAMAINQISEGPLAELKFTQEQLRELEYAGLLHDFGKVYIDKSIFLKEKKLFPKDLNNLLLRLGLIYRTVEIKEEETECEQQLEKLQKIRESVIKLNEPRIFDDYEEGIKKMEKAREEFDCKDPFNTPVPLLTESDLENLSIRRGSLNPEERKEIQSHVSRTYDFVSRIPWPEGLSRVPEIAAAHHEALDGSGYPEGLQGDEIPIGSQIMSIADIFDALAAADRPYKKALPIDRVLKILREEANKGILNKHLVEVFIEKEIYLR